MRILQCKNPKDASLNDVGVVLVSRLIDKFIVISVSWSKYWLVLQKRIMGSDNKKLFHTIDCLLHRRPEKFYPSCESLNELSTQFNNFFTNKIAKIREELANDKSALIHLPEFDTSPPDSQLFTYLLTNLRG